MFNNEALQSALQQPWTSVYAKVVALVLVYGAIVHIGNIAGFAGRPWLSTPLLWRGMDVALLSFDLTVAIALWLGRKFTPIVVLSADCPPTSGSKTTSRSQQ